MLHRGDFAMTEMERLHVMTQLIPATSVRTRRSLPTRSRAHVSRIALAIVIAIALFMCGSAAFAQPEAKRFCPLAPQFADNLGLSVGASGATLSLSVDNGVMVVGRQ